MLNAGNIQQRGALNAGKIYLYLAPVSFAGCEEDGLHCHNKSRVRVQAEQTGMHPGE